MNGITLETYDLQDMSKQTKNKSENFSRNDSVMDLYAEVDGTKKFNHVAQRVDDKNTHDAVTSDNFYYNTVTNSSTEDYDMYDSASAPTYSQLDRNKVPHSIPSQNIISTGKTSSASFHEVAELRNTVKQGSSQKKIKGGCWF